MTIPLTILQQETVSGQAGDWTQSVPFNQFDPAAGDLLSAGFTTTGTIDTSAWIENLAPVAATVTIGVAATIVATAPDVGVVGSVTPDVSASVNLGAFQRPIASAVDFLGPSGTVLADLTNARSDSTVFQTGSTSAAPFVGTGTFDVAVSSYATSTVDGNGNLAVLLHSTAGAVLTLQYDATAPGGSGGATSDSSGFLTMLAPLAFGNIVENSITTIPQVVILPSKTSGWTGTASFAAFDPARGVLEAIILRVGNGIAGTFSAANLESVPATVDMTETASMTVTTPGFATGVTATASAAEHLLLGPHGGVAAAAAPSTLSDTVAGSAETAADLLSPIPIHTSSVTLTDSADLAAFSGTGTIALPVSTAGTSVVTGPANLFTELTQHTGGVVSVSYVYAPALLTPGGPLGGPVGGTPLQSITAMVDASVLGPPTLAFLGSFLGGAPIDAKSDEAFVIGAGTTQTIDGFSAVAGDQLDLTGLLAGAPLASDLSNLGTFVSIAGQSPEPGGATGTTLAFTGPEGTASVTLVGAGPVAVADLLNDNALMLPSH